MNILNIKEIAKETLRIEANAIESLTSYIDEDFEQVVDSILKSTGRVVVSGIGKSAIIAQKIVATFNSTGTPSLYMHAADAIHGDLGMIRNNDIVICISNSGNTPEIKVLAPLIKQTGSILIGMVGNVNSYLAEQSDFILNATIEREADPNNLAPTTSTTATLALGDAIAVCLIHARNFGKKDFAKYHPGGTLGKQLYLKVHDLIKNHDLPSVKQTAKLSEVIIEISSKRLGATAVLDDNNRLLGIITDGDIRRMLKEIRDIQAVSAHEIMSMSPKSIDANEYAVVALKMMRENNISQLVVTDDENVVGFVHLHDLLKEGIV